MAACLSWPRPSGSRRCRCFPPLGGGTAVVDILLLAAIAITFLWLGSTGLAAHLPYASAVAV